MPIPLIPIALGAAALGGIIWAVKSSGGAPPSGAKLADLADRVATKMPRGEYAFKPESAQGIVGGLATKFYEWPDPNERRVVRVKPNLKGSPITLEVSAMGWAQSMNKTQSILAMLTMATTAPGDQLMRAVAPGTESQYASAGGLYGVLLYAGTLDKQLPPPGTPPLTIDPNAPIPLDALDAVRQELAAHPDLLVRVIDILQNGGDPDAIDAFAAQLEAQGLKATPALLHKLAAQLRQLKGVKPATPAGPTPTPVPGGGAPAPVAPPGLPGLPPPAALNPGDTAIVVTQTDPLLIRSGPSTSASVLGKAPKGATVSIMGPAQSGFYPLVYSGIRGFGYGGYLKLSSGGVAPPSVGPIVPPPPPPGQPPLPPPNVVAIGSATVATQKDPLSLRSAPSTSAAVVGSLPKGATVTITGAMQNGFYPVSFGNLHGFAYGGYLQQSSSPVNPAAIAPPPPTSPNLPPINAVEQGAMATVTTQSSPLTLRANPSTTAPIVGSIPKGATVQVTGPSQNGFYPVAYGSAHGYAYGGYLTMQAPAAMPQAIFVPPNANASS